MENRRNYYRVLQVQPGAPVEIIRASYRTLMQRLKAHPDLGGDHWNAAIINEAYAVLTDPEKRARYDREFPAGQRRSVTAPGGGQAEQELVDAGRCLFCHAPHRNGADQQDDALCARCGSPLHRATLLRLAERGQRAIERLPRHYPLRIYTAWPQSLGYAGESRDVSLNGISFVTAGTLVPQSIVKLDSAVCQAVIEVVNVRPDNQHGGTLSLIGARFLSVVFPRTRGSFVSARV